MFQCQQTEQTSTETNETNIARSPVSRQRVVAVVSERTSTRFQHLHVLMLNCTSTAQTSQGKGGRLQLAPTQTTPKEHCRKKKAYPIPANGRLLARSKLASLFLTLRLIPQSQGCCRQLPSRCQASCTAVSFPKLKLSRPPDILNILGFTGHGR